MFIEYDLFICNSLQDVDDARNVFSVARASCKYFAFVHVSAAQLELSQGIQSL